MASSFELGVKMIPVYLLYKNEDNFEENWQRLKEKADHAVAIQSTGSIFESHKTIAQQCDYDKFYVVDADSWIVDNFKFENSYELRPKSVAVFRAKNPVNGLVYGHGGIKLFSKDCFDLEELDKPDMTTTVANEYNKVNILASEHRFNFSPFSTWRTAFRETVKLSAGVNKNNKDNETMERLEMWCHAGLEAKFGYFSVQGARQGVEFAEQNPNDLHKVNDFVWLKEYFVKWIGS